MSKELKALEKLEDEIPNGIIFYEDELSIIEKELLLADSIKGKLKRWLELLSTDGCNSKSMVATDIQKILEEL